MNFELSDEQQQLQDSVDRLLSDQYSFLQRRAIAAAAPGHSAAVWGQLAEMGITGLPVAQDDGGFGGKAVDLLPVMQAFGRALLLEPYLATCVLGVTALQQAADAATRQRLLPAVASGNLLLAWAHDEGADAESDVSFRALPGSRFRVEGADDGGDALLASAGAMR